MMHAEPGIEQLRSQWPEEVAVTMQLSFDVSTPCTLVRGHQRINRPIQFGRFPVIRVVVRPRSPRATEIHHGVSTVWKEQ